MTPISRSENMRRIRAKDTSPEIILRKRLWEMGFRYRKNFATPSGRADLALPGRKIAVFIDGCFWHGCPDHYVRPKTKSRFWSTKLQDNVKRDRKQTLTLSDLGWVVIRVWEHEISEDSDACARRISEQILQSKSEVAGQWRVVSVVPVSGSDGLEDRTIEKLVNPDSHLTIRRKRHTRKVGSPPKTGLRQKSGQ